MFGTWIHRNAHKKELYKREDTITTFYGKFRVKDWAKQFHWVHYFLKYKLLIPSMKIFMKIYGKRLVSKVPDEPQFKYIQLWDRIFDNAVVNWRRIYSNPIKSTEKGFQTKIQLEKAYFDRPANMVPIKLVKEIANTIFCNDDAYAELLPFFLWEVYYTMHAEFKHLEDDKGKIYHLLHNVKGPMDPVQEIVYLKLIRESKYVSKPAGRTVCEKRYAEEMDKLKKQQKKVNDKNKQKEDRIIALKRELVELEQ